MKKRFTDEQIIGFLKQAAAGDVPTILSSTAILIQSLSLRRLDVKKRFSEEQIIGFLREADAGIPVKELCRRHGFSEASYYLWRSKFGGMTVPDAKRLKELEAENARLKKLLAEQMFANDVIKDVLQKMS
jgi:putative transposase